MYIQLLSTITALAATASAHGFVEKLTAGSLTVDGYNPNTDPFTQPPPARAFRAVQGNGPIEDPTLIDIQCGGFTSGGKPGSAPANVTAGPIAAGSQVDLFWTLWPESHVGPSITYMAQCPEAGCDTFEPGTDAVFFKVGEDGREGTSDTWGATPTMTQGGFVSYTVPTCLAPGNYLVRHELIALHSAGQFPGAQWYPSCHQIAVTGSGTSTGPAEKVAFPGAYAGSDPGITYNVYTAQTYPIPGPALFTC